MYQNKGQLYSLNGDVKGICSQVNHKPLGCRTQGFVDWCGVLCFKITLFLKGFVMYNAEVTKKRHHGRFLKTFYLYSTLYLAASQAAGAYQNFTGTTVNDGFDALQVGHPGPFSANV